VTTRRNVLLLVLLAAGIRALALFDDRDALLHEVGGLDAPQYLDMARRFAIGEWPDAEPFFWAPGYSVFLGLLTRVSGALVWLEAAQVVLGTASCVLVGMLASRLFRSERVAVLSAAIAALYGPLVYYDLQISPATLDVFLHLLLLLLLLEAQRRDRPWLWLAAGAVAAASAVTRGAVLLLLPLVVVWMLWPSPGLARRALRAHALRLAALLAPVCLVLALVVRHNVEADRVWGGRARASTSASEVSAKGGLFLSYNLGINFLLGNVAELHTANHVEHPLCFLDYKMWVFEPVLHGVSTPSAQSRYLVDEALAWMRSHPLSWLQLLGTKTLELLHGREISRDTSIQASGVDNHVLRALLWQHGLAFPSGLLIPLALLGLVLAPKRSRPQALMLAALGTQAVFILAFFVTTRYRLALWTSAIPYAAYGLSEAFDAVRSGRASRGLSRRAGAFALLAVVALVVSNHGLSPMPTAHLPFEYDHLGAMLDKRGEHDEAARQWRTALDRDPSDAQAHFLLAGYDAKREDLKAAAAHYQAGLRVAPATYAARIAYADVLTRQARKDEAVVQLRRVLAEVQAPSVRGMVCLTARRAQLDLRPDC